MISPPLFVQNLSFFTFRGNQVNQTWYTDLAIPVYVSLASLLYLLFKAASDFLTPLFVYLGIVVKHNAASPATSGSHIGAHGGRAIFTAQVLTLIGNLELVRASRYLVSEDEVLAHNPPFIAFTYAFMLALFVVLYPRPTPVSHHVTLVLATSWLVYFNRDVVPLMTYTESTVDEVVPWELIGVLSFTGVILPLITPHRYVPFDASDPMAPNPEQTASWLSRILFGYVDPIAWKAYWSPQLPISELPPLADSDHSKNLVRSAFLHLDPYGEAVLKLGAPTGQKKKPRHIFLAVLAVFRRDVILMAFLLLFNLATTLLSPYGLKRLLEYLENGGEGATVKPWVWIASLFLAPSTSTLLMQQYIMVLARATVHLEAIFTQLILQHALRIRMVAKGQSELPKGSLPSTAGPSTTSTSPEPATEGTLPQADSTLEGLDSDTSRSLVGRMNNLISSDLQTITRASDFMQLFLGAPLLIISTIVFLYTILGWSALVGALALVVQMPLPAILSRLLQTSAKKVAQKSDDRVETVAETMSVIRMIKMFGWEKKMTEGIDEKRKLELQWVLWNKIYTFATVVFQYTIPAVTMCVTFSVHTLAMGRTLNAATVFSAIALFEILRRRLGILFMWTPMIVRGNVSLGRISDFLQNTELLDDVVETPLNVPDHLDRVNDEIGFRTATFAWSDDEASGFLTSSRRRFRLNIEEELLFKRGHINLIVGPTGSGKTSLLMALLGEMHFTPSGPDAWFNLPRARGVAYAAQESWVMNATIRENILFDSRFEEARYNKVIYQCALTRDLELFKAGDHTEISEKGLTLSGGQKARITLARAIYSSADILLVDDVLAALDVHTAKWIVEKCFSGDLVQGRTLLLVTHNVSLAAPISEYVVLLGSDGQILSKGTTSDALAKNSKLTLEVVKDAESTQKAEQEIDGEQEVDVSKKANDKLIVEEESAEGHLSAESIKMYLLALGGKHWIFFWTVFTMAVFIMSSIEVLQPWLLGEWATQYNEHSPEEVNVAFYLMGYMGLVVIMLTAFICAQTMLTLGALRASSFFHKTFVDSILGTTLRWLDKTPTSRIMTRVTQDIAAVDAAIPDLFSHMFETGVILIVRFLAILFYTPFVGLFGFFIFLLCGFFGNIYMRSQLSVKREMSKAKAPVMAHFGACVEGITSIRAYGVQNTILQKSLTKVDNYSRASLVFNQLSRPIAVRVDAFGGLFAAFLGIYFVYAQNTGVSTSHSAFTLTLTVGFGPMVRGFVQILNMLEVNGNSLERLQEYMIIEQEPKSHAGGMPPAQWPSTGALHVEKLSARYSLDGPAVLHSLSFDVRSGERIGIVGRSGSGKSSLTLTLLRCIVTEGSVWYDGIDTGGLNLADLRGKVTIIPQIPELLSGTLRRNLDPFDQFDDATLNSALRDAGLYSLQDQDDEARLTLDSAVTRGGSNLSMGQRQIIALARAMVRESKLLILDEATSAIDYKTDAIIQMSLRTRLDKDVTVMAVAHRLQTVMDADRIMVLDAGNIVEFDSPRTLLQKDGGFFRTLVDESVDREALYAATSGSK